MLDSADHDSDSDCDAVLTASQLRELRAACARCAVSSSHAKQHGGARHSYSELGHIHGYSPIYATWRTVVDWLAHLMCLNRVALRSMVETFAQAASDDILERRSQLPSHELSEDEIQIVVDALRTYVQLGIVMQTAGATGFVEAIHFQPLEPPGEICALLHAVPLLLVKGPHIFSVGWLAPIDGCGFPIVAHPILYAYTQYHDAGGYVNPIDVEARLRRMEYRSRALRRRKKWRLQCRKQHARTPQRASGQRAIPGPSIS